MKRVFILALTLSLLLSCVPLAAYAQGTTPAGTAITTAAEFEAMTATGTYYLANDINFEGKNYENGYILQTFSGTLDGNGKAIYGFNLSSTSNMGVFQYVDAATIKNLKIGTASAPVTVAITTATTFGPLAAYQNGAGLTITNVETYVDISSQKGGLIIGGLIGVVNSCTITNCTVNGEIDITADNWVWAGGFVAQLKGARSGDPSVAEFVNCINRANISVETPAESRIGGIATSYKRNAAATFTSCANFGNLTGVNATDTTCEVGGILGSTSACAKGTNTIEKCFNFGAVSSDIQSGGILGNNVNTAIAISNSVNYGTITGKADNFGGVCGTKLDATTVTASFDATATPDANPATATVGIQEKAGANNTLDVRFVASVDSLEHQNVGVAGVAYWIEDGQVKTWSFRYNCQTVYKSIQASVNDTTVEYAATDHGGNYLMALTIAGVPTDVNVTFKLTSFAEDTSGAVVYGQTSEVKYENGTRVGA